MNNTTFPAVFPPNKVAEFPKDGVLIVPGFYNRSDGDRARYNVTVHRIIGPACSRRIRCLVEQMRSLPETFESRISTCL